ncbi:receptor-like serine threonine-protein kinase [Musa troglodytarum]|uniref:non-specific serine/threonine protein kinase n=1 Tax=Musa troglodytarum TaxID=320322 RepID=A0A9E7IH08_9LILI|nr:receptor-like serine threonine-protein kinase [Musa troglodytarum]
MDQFPEAKSSLESRMETMRNFIVRACLGFLAAAILVNGQPGFVSIDCGASRGYTDSDTGILYEVDDGYVDTGRNDRIAEKYTDNGIYVKTWFTVRSFPEGTRNCYTIPGLKEGDRYLVRASFVHGNYDGQAFGDSVAPPLLFDLYVGVNLWRSINITEVFALYGAEIITAAPSDSLSICLADIGSGTPFISSLELRHIDNHLAYRDANRSAALVLDSRYNFGSLTNDTLRYPEDKYDRTWDPCNRYISGCETWDFTSSTLGIKTTRGDAYEVPGVVMGTATVAADNFTLHYSLGYGLDSSVETTFYIYLHFADFDYLSGNGSRIFQEPDSDNISPAYLLATHVHFIHQLAYPGLYGYFNLTRVAGSTLPPILNAAEFWQQIQPMKPLLSWVEWDLSNNDLTGPIPPSLEELTSLNVLILSNNRLNGSIPASFCDGQSKGLLELRVDNNPDMCLCHSTCQIGSKGRKLATFTIVLIAVIVALIILLLLSLLLFFLRRKKSTTNLSPPIQDALAIPETHRFTYDELKAITNNFDLVLGKGGFGNVYHGRLHDGTELAVKLLHSHRMVKETSSESSMSANSGSRSHGLKEFQAEALLLSRVHHRNLVSLIGYCRDSNQLGLVYEYAARGSLRDHLSDKSGNSQTLSWRERIRIAVEAAQGLEYLHKGCVPPIIHRDVKTNNILLTHDFEAKVADFGLSKPFLTDAQTHVSTDVVVGTPGYVDPQYSATFQLTEKSDVYSFGVVLLELVTGRSAMLDQPKRCHLVQWVRSRLAEADITKVADPKLGGRYNNGSILKVIDLAMQCVDISAHQRPTMTEVVMRLKESLQPENNYGSDTNAYMEINDAANSGMASEAMLARFSV